MRLFMDHAQRTVDMKKWPGTVIVNRIVFNTSYILMLMVHQVHQIL